MSSSHQQLASLARSSGELRLYPCLVREALRPCNAACFQPTSPVISLNMTSEGPITAHVRGGAQPGRLV